MVCYKLGDAKMVHLKIPEADISEQDRKTFFSLHFI